MKKAILNEYALNGYTVYANAPVGTILSFGGNTVPVGYLLCNGQAVSRTDYSALYNAIGTTYGSGDGITTFNVPDLRECTLVGSGQNGSLEITAHDIYELGEFKDDQMQGHKHTIRPQISSGESDGKYKAQVTTNTQSSGAETGVPINDGINGTPRTGGTTHGKQIGVNYIIKATEYASLEANAIDDTKATTGNTWSADKLNKLSTYSTDETVVGTWIDGKPIYRRTFVVMENGVLGIGWSKNESEFTYTDLSFIKLLIYNEAITDNGILSSFSSGTINMSYNSGIIKKTTNSFEISNSDKNGYSGNNCFLTIEYTKTTD